jgi:CHRD domain-containing protein
MRTALALTAGLLAAATVAATAAPAGADSAGGHGSPRVAAGVVRLDGASEVPGPGDADGRGTFAYVAFDGRLCYVLTARRIEPATTAHVHQGAPDVAGPIVVGLTPPTRGLSLDCIEAVPDTTPNTTEVLTQTELDGIVANPAGFYANVHNAPFPAGAIRGQLH